MNKRKTTADKTAASSKAARPKKRVAVSLRKNAATKAMYAQCLKVIDLDGVFTDSAHSIARNATTSPLLTLPTEIREHIWTAVLGNNLIHLEYQNDDELSFKDNETLNPHPWKHLICQEDCKENRPDVKHTFETEPETLVYYLAAHAGCDPDYETPKWGASIVFEDHETMHLTVLRVCNQIYTEAARVLWTSNTFSFRNGMALKRFIMTRSIKQKGMMRSLRLEMGWWTQDYEEWEMALTMQALNSLPNLRRLRLHITHKMDAQRYKEIKNSFLRSIPWGDSMRKLSTVPWTSAEVHVRLPELLHHNKKWWTESDMKEVADMLRELLLNPEGAELYAEQQRQLQEKMGREL